MNEKLEMGKSLSDAGITNPEQVIRIISERMLDTRPRQSIRLRPYMEQAIRQNSPFGPYEADFTACWPEAKVGWAAYAAARFYASREQEVILTVGGTLKLWFNNELLLSTLDGAEWKGAPNGIAPDGSFMIPVCMRKGWNELLLKSIRDYARWGFHLTIGFPRYPGMWAKDYLFATRPTFPQKDLQGEEGFAYIGPFEPEKEEGNEGFLLPGPEFPYFPETDELRIDAPEGALSWQPTASERNVTGFVDLNELYGEEAACAYGLTYYAAARTGLTDLALRIYHTSAVRIWIDGEEVYRSMSEGWREIPIPQGGTRGQVLVKSVRSEVKWGFEAAIIDMLTDQRVDELPDLDTWRGDEARWLYIGPFGRSNSDPRDLLEHTFPVEREARFDRPYPTGEPGKFTFGGFLLPLPLSDRIWTDFFSDSGFMRSR
ncbi:hypothetical protein [Paenibacillus sp. N3.4]|uniref:hypothetical protein n=1 Tax=Paenibacillus sp. N3.4 TaxID=2603222 RepID=UPI0011CA549B|nr:hypothetical protein [Paenibacillus sp. N3.4]TXK81456.1 hypothetical protein FU659_16290 [Paenibacillus sp. N3.4]